MVSQHKDRSWLGLKRRIAAENRQEVQTHSPILAVCPKATFSKDGPEEFRLRSNGESDRQETATVRTYRMKFNKNNVASNLNDHRFGVAALNNSVRIAYPGSHANNVMLDRI